MSWVERRRKIVARIRNTLAKAKENDLEIDEDKLIIEICSEYGCSRRTALDYLKTAKSKKIKYLK